MLRNVLVLVVATIGATGVLLVGCREQTPEEKRERAVRKMVEQVLKNVEFPKGSRISFCTTLFEPGTKIQFRRNESIVLEASGYLIFVDEVPENDWDHAAQMVFFEPIRINIPRVLFRDTGPDKIVDKNGKEIFQQKWTDW